MSKSLFFGMTTNISKNLRLNIKSLLGGSLWPLSQVVMSRISGANGLILMFHYIREPILAGVSEDLFVSPKAFGNILDLLVQSFHVLEPEEFFVGLKSGKLPRRATLLTFDDGSVDMVTEALPELKKRGLKACFFVCPELINRDSLPPTILLMQLLEKAEAGVYSISFPVALPEGAELPKQVEFHDEITRAEAYFQFHNALLKMPSIEHPAFFEYLMNVFDTEGRDDTDGFQLVSWSELRELANAGMFIGNHTLNHSTIDADGPGRFKVEVGSAFEKLETYCTGNHKVFCFPYGRKQDVTAQAVDILRDQDVDLALATQGGIASPSRTSLWELRRESAYYSLTHVKLIPLLASLREIRRRFI